MGSEMCIRDRLYITTAAVVNGKARVAPASTASASTRPGLLMALEDASASTEVRVIEQGLVEGLNTATLTQGEAVFLGENGALTHTPSDSYVQPVGVVKNANASNGSVYFSPSGPGFVVGNGSGGEALVGSVTGTVQTLSLIHISEPTRPY